LHGELTFKGGKVEQSNFHDYPVLCLNEMPAVETHIVETSEKSGGVGEVGVPPLAPAVANAVFAATGKRLRRLPFSLASQNEHLAAGGRNRLRKRVRTGRRGHASGGGRLPTTWETFKVKGEEVLQKVREILHEGNVRHVVVRQGSRTVAEFPVTFGVVGVLA